MFAYTKKFNQPIQNFNINYNIINIDGLKTIVYNEESLRQDLSSIKFEICQTSSYPYSYIDININEYMSSNTSLLPTVKRVNCNVSHSPM